MKPYLIYLNILIILVLSSTTKSQILPIKNSYVTGNVINDSTGQSIAFVHIFNESRRQGFISDENGAFRIPVNEGDTLAFRALGYFARVVILSEHNVGQDITIKLTRRFYEIEEVRVRLFKDYEDFKRQFLALELPQTQTDRLRNNLATISRKEAKQADYERQIKEILERPAGISVTIPIRSREERQLSNYAEILKKEERQRVIDKKYNREIIYEITHISEDEITEFMGFCNFSNEFLFKASEYEILVIIEAKFKEYKLWKENGSFYFDYAINPEELIS